MRRLSLVLILVILLAAFSASLASAAPLEQEIQPRADIPAEVTLVAAVLGALLTGQGTYRVADWLFGYAEQWGFTLTPEQKCVLVFPVCLVIALVLLTIGVLLGIFDFTPNNVLIAFTAGYAASQLFHLPDLKKSQRA